MICGPIQPQKWDGTLISSSHHGGFSPGFFVGKPDWLKTEAFLCECGEMNILLPSRYFDILRVLIHSQIARPSTCSSTLFGPQAVDSLASS